MVGVIILTDIVIVLLWSLVLLCLLLVAVLYLRKNYKGGTAWGHTAGIGKNVSLFHWEKFTKIRPNYAVDFTIFHLHPFSRLYSPWNKVKCGLCFRHIYNSMQTTPPL